MKTYLVAAIGLVYLAGCYMGYWEYDEKLMAGFGFTGLAALRSGVKRADPEKTT